MEIEERIKKLEVGISVPGTQLSRALLEDGTIGWVLSVGKMRMPKNHYIGNTINECFDKAELDK